MDISVAPKIEIVFLGWNDTSPGAGISISPDGVLDGVGVASEERGDLRKKLRILEELGVIVIAV